MNENSQWIKQSQLLGRLVLDRRTTEALGKIDRLGFDLRAHKVLAVACKSGLFKTRWVPWERLYSIGQDSIVANSDPGETDWEKQGETDWEKPEDSIIGCELWTDVGNKAGKIEDCLLDLDTGYVVCYLFGASGWGGLRHRTYLLAPEAIASMGRKRVLASVEAVQMSEPYSDRLDRFLERAKEFIVEDREKTQQELAAAKEQFAAFVGQFTEDTQPKFEQAKEKVQSIAEQAKEKAKELAEEAKKRIDRDSEPAAPATEETPPDAGSQSPQSEVWDDEF
ncbi:MAG: PRC-barrel domain-containing protein [Cyanobacteriota bacterium]|nr:PRC-barrel domain-containing protein [Cyanobacteriota bacterium]